MPPGDTTRKSGEHRASNYGSGEFVTFGHLEGVMGQLTNALNGKATSGEVQLLIQAVSQVTRNQEIHSERMEKGLSGIYSRCQQIAEVQSEEKAKLATGIERCNGHHIGVADLYDKHAALDQKVDAIVTANEVRTAQETQAEKLAQPSKTIIETVVSNLITAAVVAVIGIVGALWINSEAAARDKERTRDAHETRDAAAGHAPQPAPSTGP